MSVKRKPGQLWMTIMTTGQDPFDEFVHGSQFYLLLSSREALRQDGSLAGVKWRVFYDGKTTDWWESGMDDDIFISDAEGCP